MAKYNAHGDISGRVDKAENLIVLDVHFPNLYIEGVRINSLALPLSREIADNLLHILPDLIRELDQS